MSVGLITSNAARQNRGDDMAAANKTTKTVKVDPNWGQMFRLGEQLIKDADFSGKAFVLEMYQFGARCYGTLGQNPDNDQPGQNPDNDQSVSSSRISAWKSKPRINRLHEIAEYVVQWVDGADGVTEEFEVRGVRKNGNSEPIDWLPTYAAAERIARRLNHDELGSTVFPGPNQAWLFSSWHRLNRPRPRGQ